MVAHTTEGAISLVDAPALRVRRVLGGFDEPRYTAGHPGGRLAFVTDSGRHDITVVDVSEGSILRRTRLGGPARHLSIDASGRRIWVALGSKAEELVVLDLSTPARPRVLRRITPPYLAHDVGWTPAAEAIWVTSGDRGTIGVYDPRTHRLLRRLAADASPQHVAFVGGRAYVASGDEGTLRVHTLEGSLLRTAAVPVGSYNVQQGGGVVLTPSLERGTLTILAPNGSLRHRVRVARSSHDACVVLGR